MPLPDGGKIPWPPADHKIAYDRYQIWSAWYAGIPEQLSLVYGGATTVAYKGFVNHPSQYRGGLVGAVARMFWGQPTPSGEKPNKLHIPAAADLATLSADLLFAEPPTLRCAEKNTGTQLLRILERGDWHAKLLEAAEVQSPLGGVYLVVTWDDTISDVPFFRAVHADAAVPEFQWDRLKEVTFWRIVAEDGGKTWRHLEHHEKGRILHGLYLGSYDQLGFPVPLEDQPATRRLKPEIETIPNKLTAIYIPNMRPNPVDRNSPLGRSDYSPGVITLMDALDECYTSWMRDIDLARARLIVPEHLLQPLGPGKGARWDDERHIFTAVTSMPDDPIAQQIQLVQFGIRVQEHAATGADLYARIVRHAGYSMQSLGEDSATSMTATEVGARERKSLLTRGKKSLYWRAGLADACETLLMVAASKFGAQVIPERPAVAFPDAVKEQPLVMAQTVSALAAAEAVSTETKVRMAHPTWTDPEILAEAQRIHAETGIGSGTADQEPDLRGEQSG